MIQIFALILMAIVLFRETKRDRINELRKASDLRDLFSSQQKFIALQIENALSSIRAQIELTYTERYDELTKTIGYVTELVEVYTTEDNSSDERHQELLSKFDSLAASHTSIEAQLLDYSQNSLKDLRFIKSMLEQIQEPIVIWGEAMQKNEIKKGEANRTLRLHLQNKEKALVAARQSLAQDKIRIDALSDEIVQLKSASRDMLLETMKEISEIRAWMESRGIPSAHLDTHLQQAFKSQVPSCIYSTLQNEKLLQEAVLS